jgi:hypothetical protein
MGLDMYLSARRHISDEGARDLLAKTTADATRYGGSIYLPRWDHSGAEAIALANEVIAVAGLTPMVGEETHSVYVAFDGSHVTVTASYWRKANAVHAWFVDNCQDGVDECQEAEVHPEQLAALKTACETALAAYRAGDLRAAGAAMAPRQGFFGGYDLDEYWAEDMAYTVTEIDRIVRAAIAIGGVEFVYQSSW